jgi:hypothetical protein
VKILLAFGALAVLTSCTTLENRRDMYTPQKVNGPYTRALKDGSPQPEPVSGTAPVGTGSSSKNVVR